MGQDCMALDTLMETTFCQKLKEITFFLSYRALLCPLSASVLRNPSAAPPTHTPASLLLNPICSAASGAEPGDKPRAQR